MNPLATYFRILNILGLIAPIALLLYAEELISAESFYLVDDWTNTACLALPLLADTVEGWAGLVGLVRMAIRWVVTGKSFEG